MKLASPFTLARRQVAAIARRDLLIEVSYPFAQLNRLFMITVQGFFVFYVARLVDNPDEIARYDGTYFEFVIVGLAVVNFASLGLHTFSDRVMAEQRSGTLEVLLAGPVRFLTILAGSMVVPLVWALVEVAALVGIGLGVAGVGLRPYGVLVALPVLLLTLTVFCGFGVLIAAISILVKRGDPISGPLAQITLLFSGALFPVEVFPAALRFLAYVFPPFYGIRGIREALLRDGGFRQVGDEIAILAASSLVLVVAAMAVFRWAVREAKRIGLLHAG